MKTALRVVAGFACLFAAVAFIAGVGESGYDANPVPYFTAAFSFFISAVLFGAFGELLARLESILRIQRKRAEKEGLDLRTEDEKYAGRRDQ